ncbi:MAG: hypothetical protein RLZZ623_2764 [Actinomycetota bacterium]
MNQIALEQKSRTVVRVGLIILALVVMVGAILFIRGWRPTTTTHTTTASSASMPTNAEIESKYGIKFLSVDITAAGGMIQVRFQVLDSDKAEAVHAAPTTPFVIAGDGTKFADPGMVGHSHVGKAKPAGATDFVLLANSAGSVKPGDKVSIQVGDLQLRNVTVD